MKINQPIRWGWSVNLGVVLLSLACSPLTRLSATNTDDSALATRTPLPTFTATSPAEDVVLLPTATEPPPITPTFSPPTPTPPATNTPLPPEPQAEEAEASEAEGVTDEASEEAPTETQDVAESAPPPTAPPPSTPEPEPPAEAPPAEPAAGAHGVIGKITFRDGRNTYAVGEKVFVKIEATNTQPGQLPFGILGLTTSTGAFQTSWSSGTIDGTFSHEDGLPFAGPGNHKMWLSICFSTEAECQGSDGDWERFEPGLDVIIQ